MKKTFAAFTLTLVTVLGASFAHAGIIISDAPATGDGIIVGDNRCEQPQSTGIIISDAPGIIVGDFAEVIGGIIVGDYASNDCGTDRTGIIISD